MEDNESKNVNIEHDSLTEHYQDDSLVAVKDVDQIKLESLDSLQHVTPAKVQPDSLSYDEDTFERSQTVRMPPTSPLEYYDSISSVDKRKAASIAASNEKKKLIIPYTDSYSSNTSVFTSQEESLDSKVEEEASQIDEEEEEEEQGYQRDINALTLDIQPMLNRNDNESSAKRLHQVATQNYYRQAELLKRPVSASPIQAHHHMGLGGNGRMLPTPNMYIRPYHQSNPDLRRGYSPSAHLASSPTNSAKLMGRHPPGLNKNISASVTVKAHVAEITQQQQLQQQIEEQNKNHNQQSLVKLATERMKRKFLGWN